MYISSGQALFRGASRYWPEEVWIVADQAWKPYQGEVPKPEGWGDFISEAEAEELKKP